jgi:hypothetical protein
MQSFLTRKRHSHAPLAQKIEGKQNGSRLAWIDA